MKNPQGQLNLRRCSSPESTAIEKFIPWVTRIGMRMPKYATGRRPTGTLARFDPPGSGWGTPTPGFSLRLPFGSGKFPAGSTVLIRLRLHRK